ncbi:kinase-like protein [Zalerion maritima]|uniref:non-specific serine/threonine protein kinase n=1 Tax=Zalerion maritima TaxID=339359 RepID=A0AAD5WV52_9PEZI|nr:kinase-like protein [Zalerion maritima]
MMAPRQHQPAAYGAPVHIPHHPAAPAGTFTSGTKIQVGNHRVVIQKYLSEGGFAHVYLVKLSSPIDGTDLAVLKRVAVPDKDALRGMRTEVETMKRLKGHRPIVTYFDSHASELKGGGYEVFLLMEFCNGGGLIDFMNTRLQHRLTESEILQIFTDVAEGVACMHYLKPPLLHRDIKVENVLITTVGSRRRFKVCDFGSAAIPTPAPTSIVECRLMEEDVQKHTTLQYRSPEMVDVYRKQPINEKSDIWALGVLLYKLCYYTTPFEDQGQLAILNASLRFPSHPVFSERLKRLITTMLQERQQARPNIYQALKEACSMQGHEVPVQDIYSNRTSSNPPKDRPVSEQTPAPAQVGASFAPTAPKQQVLPDIVPMRRGRPPAGNQSTQQAAKNPISMPSKTSPATGFIVTNGDPFAALDKKLARGAADELSSKFPTLDEFSLLHDHGSTFNFDNPSSPPLGPQNAPSQNMTARLDDDEFPRPQAQISVPSGASHRLSATPPKPQVASPPTVAPVVKPASAPTKSAVSSRPMMVSQGTMTAPSPEPEKLPQIYRFPPADKPRTSSLTKAQEPLAPRLGVRGTASRTSSYQGPLTHIRHPSSSRPSLETSRPNLDSLEPLQSRTMPIRPRPASTHLESNMDFLRERENSKSVAPAIPSHRYDIEPQYSSPNPKDQTAIQSNVEFLRSMEGDGKKDKIKHGKRSSITSLPGTKTILSGKFGNVFKKFEGNNSPNQPAPRTPSPLKDMDHRELTPIAGSEATEGRSDDGKMPYDEDDMSPEMRREMERRRLSAEEKRVEAAAAEYRKRVAGRKPAVPLPPPKSIGGVPRAISIQNKVERLLDESQRSSSNVARTAEGYGKYSDAVPPATKPADKKLPDIPRKPVGSGAAGRSTPVLRPEAGSGGVEGFARPSSTAPIPTTTGSSMRPSTSGKPAPKPAPKPMHLNNVRTGPRSTSPTKINSQAKSADTLVPEAVTLDMSVKEKEDYIRDFQKRYPSLTALEMVETEIGMGSVTDDAAGGRSRRQ